MHDHVAGLGDAAVGEDGDALGLGCLGCHVECRHLWNADTSYDACGANGSWTLSDLDDVCTRIGEELNTFGAGNVAGDESKIWELRAEHANGVAYAL